MSNPSAASLSDAIAATHEMTVRYGAKIVLDSLSVSVPAGCTGLLGPNGAGKTTLIKTLMGFLEPSGGTRTVMGKDVARDPLHIRQHIGLMPEQECHIPGMNAVTFVAYAGELAGMPTAQAIRRAHEVLEYVGLGEARYRNVETFSTGMKQRVKFAQALVHGPQLLFLDEPTNGLDPQGRDEMLSLIHDISHGKGHSVVVSSHLLTDIEKTCDNVIVMRGGTVVRQGTTEALRQTGTPEVEVDLRAFSPSFADSMARRGAALTLHEGARCRFTLPDGAAESPGRLVFAAARESEAQVRAFRIAQRRLEDVFQEALAS